MSKTAVALLSLGIGLTVGFFLGVGATKAGAAFLKDFTTSEAPAEVARPMSYSGAGFSFRYPGNWKVKAEAEKNEPAHHVNVESPGSCVAMIFSFDVRIEPATSVRAQVDAFVPKLMASPARSTFGTWGKYSGEGALLRGKLLGLSPGSLRVFSHATEARSFVIVEQCYDEDMKAVKPGFDLVERSFDLSP